MSDTKENRSCRSCGELFKPLELGQVCCSWHCASTLAHRMRTSHVALVPRWRPPPRVDQFTIAGIASAPVGEHRPNRKHRISEALAEMKASVAAMNAAIYRRPIYKLN